MTHTQKKIWTWIQSLSPASPATCKAICRFFILNILPLLLQLVSLLIVLKRLLSHHQTPDRVPFPQLDAALAVVPIPTGAPLLLEDLYGVRCPKPACSYQAPPETRPAASQPHSPGLPSIPPANARFSSSSSFVVGTNAMRGKGCPCATRPWREDGATAPASLLVAVLASWALMSSQAFSESPFCSTFYPSCSCRCFCNSYYYPLY